MVEDEGERRRQARRRPHQLSQLVSHRVLLIEDHVELAEVTAEFMRQENLEVRVASSGREAMEIAATFQPEIVLCDMNLPDTTGIDIVRDLRSRLTKRALIAIHTAIADSDFPLLQRHLPEVNMFISKPLTSEKLDELLSKFVNLQRAVSDNQT